MIGKVITIGLLSIGIFNAFVDYDGVGIQYQTNFVYDLLDREVDDRVAFQLDFVGFDHFNNMSNGDHRYFTQYVYINNTNQSIYYTWSNTNIFSSFAGSTNSMLNNMLTNKPAGLGDNYSSFGYYIDAQYSTTTGLRGYYHFVFANSGTWRFNGAISLMQWYFFYVYGADYTFNFYDNVFGLTSSNYYDGVTLHGNFADNYNGGYLYTQRVNFSADTTHNSLDDISFSFYSCISPRTGATYDDGYNDGYNDGYSIGWSDGYSIGNRDGIDTGYQDGVTAGYQQGYNQGYSDGLNISTNSNFLNLFGLIADTPVMMLRSLFNFDLFGIHVFTAIMSLLTGIFLIFIIKKVWK